MRVSPAGLVVCLALAAACARNADPLFDRAALHDIRLTMNPADWSALRQNAHLNTFYRGDLSWNGRIAEGAGVRSRGSGSRNSTKPGLKIDFNEYERDRRFLGLRSLVLDNLVQDASMLRERISMQFFDRMGWPAPRATHVRLYVNDEYAGLYGLVEDVNQEFLERAFRMSRQQIADHGYLFEYRWRDRYTFTYLGPGLKAYATIFDAKLKGSRPAEEVYGPIKEMIRTVNEAPPESFLERAGQYLDLPGVMTFFAISTFLADWDGWLGDFGINNFYLARFEKKRFAAFIPWDKDTALFTEPGNPTRGIDWPILYNIKDNVLARRSFEVPRLREAYFRALLRSADSAGGWMEQEIRRAARLIRDAAAADPVKPYSTREVDEAIVGLLRFARERPKVVRDQVAATWQE